MILILTNLIGLHRNYEDGGEQDIDMNAAGGSGGSPRQGRLPTKPPRKGSLSRSPQSEQQGF